MQLNDIQNEKSEKMNLSQVFDDDDYLDDDNSISNPIVRDVVALDDIKNNSVPSGVDEVKGVQAAVPSPPQLNNNNNVALPKTPTSVNSGSKTYKGIQDKDVRKLVKQLEGDNNRALTVGEVNILKSFYKSNGIKWASRTKYSQPVLKQLQKGIKK